MRERYKFGYSKSAWEKLSPAKKKAAEKAWNSQADRDAELSASGKKATEALKNKKKSKENYDGMPDDVTVEKWTKMTQAERDKKKSVIEGIKGTTTRMKAYGL